MSDFIVNPRRAPRAPSRCRIRVQSAGATWDSETEDVGPHGCQLVAPAPLSRGVALQLALLAPGVGEPLRATGKVAWVSSQPPWRLGVAFEDASRPAAGRWFDLLVASRPGLGAFRRVPDRLPVDAMVFLGPPPRFADFSADEVSVLRHVAGGVTIAALRERLREGWAVQQRALFALLSRGALTVSRGAAAHPEAWRRVMIDLGAEFVEPPAAVREAPLPPPAAPRALRASAATLEAMEAAARELPDPSGPFEIERTAPPLAPPPRPLPVPSVGPPPLDEPELPPLLPSALAPPPPPDPAAPPGVATAGTGWRGTSRSRSPEAQQEFDLGRAELELGHPKDALAHFRRALQLAPGDAELAAALGLAMKG